MQKNQRQKVLIYTTAHVGSVGIYKPISPQKIEPKDVSRWGVSSQCFTPNYNLEVNDSNLDLIKVFNKSVANIDGEKAVLSSKLDSVFGESSLENEPFLI